MTAKRKTPKIYTDNILTPDQYRHHKEAHRKNLARKKQKGGSN